MASGSLLPVLRRSLRSPRAGLKPASRSASSVASSSQAVLSPAVAFLVGRNRIDAKTLERVPRSGPKNRILKGDIIHFLASPSSAQSVSPINLDPHAAEAHQIYHLTYSANIVINELVTFVKNHNDESRSTVSVSDMIARASYIAAQETFGDATGAAKGLLISRSSPVGNSHMLYTEPEEVGALKISKTFKDHSKSALQDQGHGVTTSSALIQLQDDILSPQTDGKYDIGSSQPIILTTNAIRKENPSVSRDFDDIDLLSGQDLSQSSASSSQPTVVLNELKGTSTQTLDEIDLLADSSVPGFYTGQMGECEPKVSYTASLELAVDRDRVHSKAARKFLITLEMLLKNPKKLL
ncbi:hypothetical protein DFS34DRAFT_594053 [Phlyctochytrium arcticum]|nr:hypothetical protein DFS34DRAFT_594053 [Phlyctochytrium arcticum]